MKKIQLSHKGHTHITTISEFELTQILHSAELWSKVYFSNKEDRDVQNTIKFLRASLNLK